MMYLIGTKDNSFKHKTVCRIAIKNSDYIRLQTKEVLMILSIAILRCRIYLPTFRKIAVNIRSNIFVKMPTSNVNVTLW